MDPFACIWRGVREHPSWDHVRATLTRVGGRPLRLMDGAGLERLGLEPDERAAAECLRLKTSTVPELAIVGGLTIQQTDLLAYFLVITKQAEIAERVAASNPPPNLDPSIPLRINTPGTPITSGQYVRKISFAMSAVTPDATTVRIPSPLPNRSSSPLPGRLSSIPARPSGMPTRLSSAPAAGSGLHSSVHRISSPPSARPGSVASSLPPRSSSAPQSAPGSMAPPSDLARKKSIVDRAKWIDQEDYFKMLMVTREATTEEIRAAFLRAAKVWHPDSLPASIADARGDCERVFTRINTAYETLVAPDKRRRYEQSIGQRLKESAEADGFLAQAEMHLTLGDRAAAAALARKALVAAPGFPEAMALLAYLEMMDARKAQQSEHLRNCLKMVDIAIGKDAMCRRGHFFRAQIKKKLEDHEGAIRDLRVAVTNDPDDQEAQRELRIYETKLRDGTIQIRSLSPFGGTKRPEGFFDRIRKK